MGKAVALLSWPPEREKIAIDFRTINFTRVEPLAQVGVCASRSEFGRMAISKQLDFRSDVLGARQVYSDNHGDVV